MDWEEEAKVVVDSVAAEEAKVVEDWEEEVTDWAEVEKVVDSVAAAEAKAAVTVESSDRRSPARCRMCRSSSRRCPR